MTRCVEGMENVATSKICAFHNLDDTIMGNNPCDTTVPTKKAREEQDPDFHHQVLVAADRAVLCMFCAMQETIVTPVLVRGKGLLLFKFKSFLHHECCICISLSHRFWAPVYTFRHLYGRISRCHSEESSALVFRILYFVSTFHHPPARIVASI